MYTGAPLAKQRIQSKPFSCVFLLLLFHELRENSVYDHHSIHNCHFVGKG